MKIKTAQTNQAPKESGQTLVAAIVLLTIALGVGLGLSTGMIKNLRATKNVDLSTRAVAVAEAAVEKILLNDYDTLEDFINNSNCGSACTLDITADDGLTAHADVTLSFLGGSSDPFPVSLSTTDTLEVNLSGYQDNTDVWVCWNDSGSTDKPSVTGLYFHGTDGDYGVDNFAYNSIGSLESANNFDEASGGLGYDNCFSVTGKENPKMLRLKAVYQEVNAFVLPSGGGVLPSQGILIVSEGSVNDVKRTVNVVKSRPFLSVQFDYVLYSKSTEASLSN